MDIRWNLFFLIFKIG